MSFAAASRPSRPSRAYGLLSESMRACRKARKFIRSVHAPFFTQGSTVNSTVNQVFSHE